ncbi:sensor histidine kinase [Streptomyces beihaiensis]|uniref:Histidine kinase n=1 Tax=Streptomyces beihaiensis TaxID=2984495 RepID=A0ABT3TTB2_9ACTN|nr:histidine kinase [Streptomyces beihaiensis]MCX3060284.1 histidine kinase [Streptomyces beihaiensis]
MEPRETPEPGRDPQRWSQGWRRTGLGTGMLAYPVITATGVAQYTSGAAELTGHLLVAAFCVCYLLALSAVGRGHRRTPALAYAVLTALFLATLPFARAYAFFLATVIVSFAALRWRRHAALIVGAGALAAIVVPWAVRPWHEGPGWMEAVALVFTALTVYAFGELAQSHRSLVEARAEVARLASQAERDRIARDLHDLLGHSLTVITVKSGLARKLAASGSPRAVDEITEVEQLSRRALADVRAAVTGYREVTLAGELARGRELLRAAGVAADLPTATDAVSPDRQELFGWTVREGLTNVVRHARASRCTVEVTATSVEIRDDGAAAPAPASGTGGNGLAGLRERVAQAGGTVDAGPARPRGWRLRVTVPEGPVTRRASGAAEGPEAAGVPAVPARPAIPGTPEALAPDQTPETRRTPEACSAPAAGACEGVEIPVTPGTWEAGEATRATGGVGATGGIGVEAPVADVPAPPDAQSRKGGSV